MNIRLNQYKTTNSKHRTQVLNKFLLSVVSLLFTLQVHAQQRVTIRELNTYSNEITHVDSLPKHPLNNEVVQFTAIVASYPRNSGLASYNQTSNVVSRIHVFVVDTSAASMGRDGMALQIVQSSGNDAYTSLESLDTGAMIDVVGYQVFFGSVSQFVLESITDVSSKITGNSDLQNRYYALLQPIEVSIQDLNVYNEDGTATVNLQNYSKYVNSYVRISDAMVIQSLGQEARTYISIKQSDADNFVYTYDISLRYRNDRTVYKDGFNYRRSEDGFISMPKIGTKVNLLGYLILNNYDPFNLGNDGYMFKINPMDDGVKWEDTIRNVNGENGFVWNNDLQILLSPPQFRTVQLSNTKPTPDEAVTITADIYTEESSTNISDVFIYYSVNGESAVEEQISFDGSTYSFTFPGFELGNLIEYQIRANDSNGSTGIYDGYFYILNVITQIEEIQKTPNNEIANSSLTGLGLLDFDIYATVVADANDGMIVIHQEAKPWSGIYIQAESDELKALRRGDVIRISKAQVFEDRNSTGVTYLDNVTFTYEWHDDYYEVYIPQLTSNQVRNNPEAYEGMVVTFNNVEITTAQADESNDFGEFEFESKFENERLPLRIDGSFPVVIRSDSLSFDDSFNENVKVGTSLASITGMIYYSFGFPKLLIRQPADFKADDWTFPTRTIELTTPTDNQSFSLSDLESTLYFEWTPTSDKDGNTVFYEVQFFELKNEAYQLLATFPSNDEGLSSNATISVQELTAYLNHSETAGTEFSGYWSVRISDGKDAVLASTYTSALFSEIYKPIQFTNINQSITAKSTLPIISTESENLNEEEAITLVFNAAKGNRELEGYTGTVYIHPGVITNFSGSETNWLYATDWGNNDAKYAMNRDEKDPNVYRLTINSLREYFGIASIDEYVRRIAFVFRSETEVDVGGTLGFFVGRTTEGEDIYIDLPYDLSSNLSASYSFNGNTLDESGSNAHGNSLDATLTKDRFGKPNSAYEFNGKDSFIYIEEDAPFQPGAGSFTISSWVYLNTDSDSTPTIPIINKVNGNYSFGFGMYARDPFGNDRPYAKVASSNGQSVSVGGDVVSHGLNVQEWTQLTLTFNGITKQLRLYKNGIIAAYGTNSTMDDVIPTSALYIGLDVSQSTITYMNGAIDDIRYFNRALTSLEINKLYAKEKYAKNTFLSIWPGDTNRDSTVSASDLIPIIRYFGQEQEQVTPSIQWQAHYRQVWFDDDNYPNRIYADTDGNGIIDAADVLALYVNYSKRVGETVFLKEQIIQSKQDSIQIEWVPQLVDNETLRIDVNLVDKSSKVIKGIAVNWEFPDEFSTESEPKLSFYETHSSFSNQLAFSKYNALKRQAQWASGSVSSSSENQIGSLLKLNLKAENVEKLIQNQHEPHITLVSSSGNYLPVILITKQTVGVDQQINEIPNELFLSQNYPNPFNPSTIVQYGLNSTGNVLLEIFDVQGRLVQTVINKKQNPGTYSVQISMENGLSSGLYLYRLSVEAENGKHSQFIRKMLLVK